MAEDSQEFHIVSSLVQALRYQQANDPAAAASGWPIAQMRPK
jgi:hypothetical protein